MTKSRRRDSIKSFLWSHIDPERDEQLQGAKIEVERKVTKMLKLVKNVDQDGRDGRREGDPGLELVELVEDLHGQYQSIFALYDNFRIELRKKVHERKEDDSSSSSSSSDSESFYSSKEVDSNNGKFEHEVHKQIKLDTEAENSEASIMEENKALSMAVTESNTAQAYEASARIEELENQVSSLQLELESALKQERSLEERVESAAAEAKEQFEEILGLRGRILELEKAENEIKSGENNAYTQIMALTTEINSLQTNISEQQRTMQEQEDTINRMNQQCKQVKVLRRQSRMNFQATERKVEEIAEQFRKSMEDNLRLLGQRIRVAERLHYENRDFYRTTREALKIEQKAFEEKVAAHKAEFRKLDRAIIKTSNTLSGFDLMAKRLSDSSEIFLNRFSKISEEVLCARDWIKGKKDELKELKGENLNLVRAVNQLEERVGELEKIVGELEKMVKERDERVEGIRELEKRVEELEEMVKEKDERVEELEEMVKEKDKRMEGRGELEKRVGELEKMVKEKDERVEDLGEEKREAIRQLCVWIDYHRNNLRSLKILSKMSSRRPTTT